MLTGVVIGAGERGYDGYARDLLAHPEQGRIVAVAEPDALRRRRFLERYSLEESAAFADSAELLSRPRLADFAIITTGDRHHVEPARMALAAGYHVLLEKPMALDEDGCRSLVEAARTAGRILQICDVYRYSTLFSRLHAVVAAGELGKVITIQLSENVAYWHYAHSYCRGHTRRSEVPMLLQKSCHDLDLLHWLAGAPPLRVSSFLRPTELSAANTPPGAPTHCIEGCPHAAVCPYDAVSMYRRLEPLLQDLALAERPLGIGMAARLVRRYRPLLERIPLRAVRELAEWRHWPLTPVSDDTSPAALDRALAVSRWGRCVYQVGDNDQPASQTVNVLFANGVNASFTMHGNSYRTMRQVRIDGTRGSAYGHLFALDGDLTVVDHKTGRRRRTRLPPAFDGHGGGERRLFRDFLAAVRGERPPLTSAEHALESHRIAFAAMQSAARGTAVELPR